MKKLISIVLLVCIVMSMCTVSAWAAELQLQGGPVAEVGNITTPNAPQLTFSQKFIAKDIGNGDYNDFYADFVLTINKDVRFNSNDPNADGYLAGAYGSYGWIPVPDSEYILPANTPIRIMNTAAVLYNNIDLNLTVSDVFNFVKEFDCGIYFSPEFLKNNPDLYVTLELAIFDPNTWDKYKITGGSYGTPPSQNDPVPAPVTPAAPVVEDIYYIPATDDNSNMALWSILALALLSTAFVTRKRKNEN